MSIMNVIEYIIFCNCNSMYVDGNILKVKVLVL